MVTHERDENEASAVYYDGRIRENIGSLIRAGQSIIEKIAEGRSMSYSQYLTLKREFEYVEAAMRNRDTLGLHSDTGKDRFRYIAHPEQYPNPEVDAALV